MIELEQSRRRLLLGLGGFTALVLPGRLPAARENSNLLPAEIEQLSKADDREFIKRAFEMRDLAIETGDQGYGALVVRDDKIIGQSPSHVVVHGDPTAHAEMEAIRDAAFRSGSHDLSGCILYSSSHACPMCEAAAYWAKIERMVYGAEASDGGRPSLC